VYEGLLKYKLNDVLRKYYETKLGELYTKIANCYFRKSEKERANNYYEKGLEILKKSGDVRRKSRLLKDYLGFIKITDLKPENFEEICTEYEIQNLVFIEEPTSFYQLYLLDYKKLAAQK
jgi:tetratricopeptide (TPR) repeat protein